LSNNDPLYDHKRSNSLREKRRKYGRFRLCACIIAAFTPVLAFSQDEAVADDLESAFDSTTIIIEAEKVACYRFDVFVATSRAQQIRGLMHVRHLPEFSGMLFVHTEPAIRSMWMKNTYISLDILFIRKDGTISNIAANTEPHSLKSISSTEPVSYVLELNAGATTRLHINTASRVHL
jgi:uncharacterized membrane protein (UPF0127 family)